MALPTIDSIENASPNATLDVLVGLHSSGVYTGRPGINVRPIMPDIATWRNVRQIIGNLRNNYDEIFVLDRSRFIRLAAQLSGADTYFLRLDTDGVTHEIDVYLGAVKQASIDVATTQPALYFPPEVVNSVDKLLEDIELPFLVVHPGGAVNPGAIMIQKRWPENRLIELIDQLHGEFQTVVFTGGPDETHLCRRINDEINAKTSVVVAGRLGLLETAYLIGNSNLYIGVDTGVSHLAAAAGAHCVVIFGPTNPLQYGPRGKNIIVVAPQESYEIADRDLRGSTQSHFAVSTEQVTIEEVYSACMEQLSQSRIDRE